MAHLGKELHRALCLRYLPVGLPCLRLATSIQQQAWDGVHPEAPPAWLPYVTPWGEQGVAWPLLIFVETTGGRNVVLGWPRLGVTHFGSFEMSFHLRSLQQHGGEVALFTEGLWLRGQSCCGQCGWTWQRGAWAGEEMPLCWRP